ncbi:MAG TPA: FecR family protein [Terriglobales bacterium]|nr:FecR family protein [Terriglobales bacterium]
MRRHLFSARSAVAAFVLAAACIAFADSHVRIVRLSSVEGQVQMDRGVGAGLEHAILNAPIVEGTRLVTGSDGLAEVQFENQSALRLASDSEVQFSQLLMNDAGDKINQVRVIKGLVYLDAAPHGHDVYRLQAGDNTFLVHRDSQMRLRVTPEKIQVAVFKGDVQMEGQSHPVAVHKKETLTVAAQDAPKDTPAYTLAKGVEEARYDAWDRERQAYSDAYAENDGYAGPSGAFGLDDLNYYGNFFYAGGYGYVWQPYGMFGLTGWNPYMNGAWMFYPGMGYSWASAYPWGWLPYHYGSWAFIDGMGWGWLPGGGYGGQWYANNFQAVPRITRAPAGFAAPPPPAVTAGSNFTPRTVLVGKAGGSPVAIPGGRAVPDFASLVPGRSVTTTAAQGFAHPETARTSVSPNVFATPHNSLAAAHHGAPAHVFAPPMRAGAFGPGFGWFDGRNSGRSGIFGASHGMASGHSAGGGGGGHGGGK